MPDPRSQYVSAAHTALSLIETDAVANAWEAPSALTGMSVGALAGHIAAQLHSAQDALEGSFDGKERIGLLEHYGRAAWVKADLDNEPNTKIRTGGARLAEDGPGPLLQAARGALVFLEAELPRRDGQETSGNPYWAYATTLDDFLTTRILEFVVHTDDLACSVDAATPVFDADVFGTATDVLTRLAASRHGQAALIRALARSERAGGDITAL